MEAKWIERTVPALLFLPTNFTTSYLSLDPEPSNHLPTMTAKLTLQSTYPLGEGVDMPVLGFGVYKSPTDVTVKSVTTALKTGYRHIVRASLFPILVMAC